MTPPPEQRGAWRVLAVNAGSSTLKVSVLDGDVVRADTVLEHHDAGADRQALAAFLADAGPVDAVGHRIVHGGLGLTAPTLLDPTVIGQLHALVPLAPLHQPRGLAAISAVSELLPGVPAVACFDTAFHATIPDAAATYAVPGSWRERWPIRRFGFHGLSHAWASRRAAELLDRPPDSVRLVTCHLGSGSSLCAIDRGRSVDTTMGFTPLEGLVMATRSGTVDPGLVLWLVEQGGLDPAEVHRGLERHGGLAGLTGGDGDLRTVLEAVSTGEPVARAAYAIWLHRLRRELGAMVAVLGGIDALVFTGGIGEHQPRVRQDVTECLAFLGAGLDGQQNAGARGDTEITGPRATVRSLVVEAREDREIARQVRAVLA